MTPTNTKCYQTWNNYVHGLEELWIFGYGSLMWRPDFIYSTRKKATAEAVARSYCIISTVYRGTPEYPGRVLGLVEGEECHGIVYCVQKPNIPHAFDAVWQREMISDAYTPKLLQVRLQDGANQMTVPALGFLADPAHEQFDGESSDSRIAEIIHTAHGPMGSNLAYFLDTLKHLEDEDISDHYLLKLHKILEKRAS